MDNIILIFLCLVIGIVSRKRKAFPKNAHQTLNQFVINVSLPALALYFIPKIEISSQLIFPLAIAWVGFGFSFLFFNLLGKYFNWSRKMIGCLILTAGLGNTSFVGFPVIQALYGDVGLESAIIIDQAGSFLVLASLGLIVANTYSRGKTSPSQIFKKVLFFPPFIAFFAAGAMNIFNIDFPTNLQSVFQTLGKTVTPIALIAVGLQLKLDVKSKHWKFLSLGLFFKLFLTPALFYLLYIQVFGLKGIPIQVSILESAMAPMVTATVLASSHGLKPNLSSMMIGIGIPISFLSLAFWYWILSFS